MTEWPTFTVAVLNHRRPHLLRRVMGAIAQLDYPAFEIVIVGDQPNLDGYDLPDNFARQVRFACLEEPNISRARNIALRLSAGDIVAFCDDDAAPEPNWLRALAEAFRKPEIAAASGKVMAADGVTVEWQGRLFLPSGRELYDPMAGGHKLRIVDAWSQTTDGRYLGLIGVNSAFRRAAVLAVGGFDEAYRYFLEETDLAIRLARQGWSSAIVPKAVVHHLREQNAVRSSKAVPRNLHQIAASKAHFCNRHMAANAVAAEMARYRAARMAELDPHLRLGTLRAKGMRKLERQLDRGLAEGSKREPILPLGEAFIPPAFHRFHAPGVRPRLRLAMVSGWGIGPIRRIGRLARQLAALGHTVSTFSYFSGPQPKRVTFSNGVWFHSGGTWRLNQRGADGRNVIRRHARALVEIAQVADDRNFDAVIKTGRRTGDEGSLVMTDNTGRSFVVSPIKPGETLSAETIAVLREALNPGSVDKAAPGPEVDELPQLRRNAAINPSVGYS